MALRPHQRIPRITALDLDALRTMGITCLVLDIDNTLVPWESSAVAPDILAWVRALPEQGFAACILSNNTRKRVQPVQELLDIPAFCWAAKPFGPGFFRLMKTLGWKRHQVAVVGDQLMTDILGGQLHKLHTVLVQPLSAHEMGFTKLVRKVERRLLKEQ